MIQIKEISAQETFPIRLEVLRKNIPLPFEFNGDFDDETFHLGAFKNDKLIAVSSYMKADNKNFSGNQYQLRGMATLTEYQGLGIGKLMLQEAVQILKEKTVTFYGVMCVLLPLTFTKSKDFKLLAKNLRFPMLGNII